MEKKRIAWLDYARSIAIICVCFCHSTEVFYYLILTGISETTCAMWILQNSLYTIGRLGVPIFLMLTGALMLNKEIKPNDFYRNYLFPLFITTEVWIIINNLFNCFISNVSFELKPLIKKMIFLDYPDLSHMWYMPMILGLYFAIPFLSIVVKNTKLNDFFWPAGLVFSFCFVLPTINIVIGKNYSTVLTLSFLGGTYGLYVLLGYYIYTAKLNMSKKQSYLYFSSHLSHHRLYNMLYINTIFSQNHFYGIHLHSF